MVKKIDFHIHTLPTKGKDYDFEYSSNWMKEYVARAELDAIAITNHDRFDEDNYNKVKEDLPNTQVFPGMELSLEDGHVNIIFSEEDINSLIEFSDWLESNNSAKITVDELCTNMTSWRKGIYIFELGKSNSLKVPERLKDVCYVGGVSNQLKFQIFYGMEEGLRPVLFSDAHADENDSEDRRKNIELLKNKNTYLQIDNCTFREIVNGLTDKRKIGINKSYLQDVINIHDYQVSTGLNLIVGKRGTGKTNFLETIKKQYNSDEIYEIAQFETSKSDDFIEQQRKRQGESAVKLWKERHYNQFSAIKEFLSSEDEDLEKDIDKYLESVKKFAKDITESNSSSKYQLIKESNFESVSTKNIENYLKDLQELINSRDLWELLTNYERKKEVFIETYDELRIVYIERQTKNSIQEKVNEIIDNVKKFVQSKTGITTVEECEFTKIIKKKQMEKEINNFMNEIICKKELKRENIFGYQIIVNLIPFRNADEFRRDISTNEAVQNDLMIPYKEQKYIEFLKNLKTKKFFKSDNLADYLLHREVKLLDSDGTPASGGQAVGFALMMRLEEAKNKSIVLIDEPEASLDNAYIREELIKAIRAISKNSTVFVVTHNSTLGALLEPDYLVVTTKNEEKEYSILTGEFSSQIISGNSTEYENSYEKFVEAMEAGIETYNRKGEVYESLRN
ncbi:AAA family ATPase [Vagococcus fluvialis]|uniref:AAA family ATPase n=1 Tax=Vagococcus fluvialis TaxID=2738 RepID=UPI003B2288DF